LPKLVLPDGEDAGHVACAILSPLAAAGSYTQKYYHYSLLRTIEDGFRLDGYLGNANVVTPIANIWPPLRANGEFRAVTPPA
jgi:hypothetical protein